MPFLRALNQLSKTRSLDDAIALLEGKIKQRQLKSGKAWMRASEPYVLRRDILGVLIEQKQFKPQMEEDESSKGKQDHLV